MANLLSPITHRVTQTDLVRYAGASHDFNPIHFDAAIAHQYGLPGIIAHGMFTMGLITRLVEPLLTEGYRVTEWSSRFRAMVPVGQTLVITGTTDEKDATNPSTLKVSVTVTIDGEPKPALTGSLTLSRV